VEFKYSTEKEEKKNKRYLFPEGESERRRGEEKEKDCGLAEFRNRDDGKQNLPCKALRESGGKSDQQKGRRTTPLEKKRWSSTAKKNREACGGEKE